CRDGLGASTTPRRGFPVDISASRGNGVSSRASRARINECGNRSARAGGSSAISMGVQAVQEALTLGEPPLLKGSCSLLQDHAIFVQASEIDPIGTTNLGKQLWAVGGLDAAVDRLDFRG